MTATAPHDPVLERRARIALAVRVGKIAGYGLYLVACVGFVVLRLDKPSGALSSIIVWSLAIGSLFLAPAIVFGYAVRAAEKEDRVAARAKAHTKGAAHPDRPAS